MQILDSISCIFIMYNIHKNDFKVFEVEKQSKVCNKKFLEYFLDSLFYCIYKQPIVLILLVVLNYIKKT